VENLLKIEGKQGSEENQKRRLHSEPPEPN
jgi:hypothetical protein